MPNGYLAFVLHAHLPYGGTSTQAGRREEGWFAECARECYLPLIRILDQLNRDGVSGRITLSLSPTLIAMMGDPLINKRLLGHLDQMIELSAREMNRTALMPDVRELTGTYHLRLLQIRNTHAVRCNGNLLRAFADLQACGRVELVTSAASHGFLPALAAMQTQAARCQIRLGLDAFAEAFGHRPSGFWLPECAYSPELDQLLGDEGVGYTVADGLSIRNAATPAVHGVHAPVYSPSSVAVFGRDREGTTMWWCDATGRPTYPVFRDGTRDIAAELPCEYLAPHFPGGSAPSSTGFCYHRLGGSNGQPNYYERKRALDEAAELAFAFMRSLQDRAAARVNSMDRPALFVAAYDLHRFGQAWFEGPEFLDYVFRKIHFDQDALEMITPGDYLHRHPCNQMTAPAMASWSEDGYFQEWINEDNAWAHRHLARAARVMHRITVASGSDHGSDGNGDGNGNGHEPGHNGDLRSRALRVAGRQLVLAQSGDWLSMMCNGERSDYGRQRLSQHLHNFSRVAAQVERHKIDAAQIRRLEQEWPIFPQIPVDAYR